MPEKIWQSGDVDVRDLLEQLTSAEQSRQVVVYDGPTCKCSNENSTSRASCTLLAMNCVRTVFEVEKGLGAKISWAWQRSRDDADADAEFLEDLLAERTVQKIVSITAYLKLAIGMNVGELCETPLFESVLSQTSYVVQETSQVGFSAMLDTMSVTASQRVTAAVITHSNEVIVCLKVKIALEDTYIIFDPHAGSISPNGPAFILERRKKTAAELLSDFAASKRTKVSHPGVQKYYARIFCPKESYLDTTMGEDSFRNSLMSSNGRALTETLLYLSRKTTSAHQVKQEPATPTEKQNSHDEIKIDTTPALPLSDLSPSTNPNTPARTHLRKEFGWQLSLQGKKISAPDKSLSDFAQAPRIITASAAPSPSEEVQPSREPRQSPKTPKASRPIKKDIGWQLALQQAKPSVNGNTTSETISKKVAKHDPVTPPAKRTASGFVNNDTAKTPNRLASPSTPSKVTPPTQHHQTMSVGQRASRSRDEYSWKLALASKSLDPLPRRPIEAPADERARPTTLVEVAHVLDPPPSASKITPVSTPVDTFICEVCFENFTVSQVARMPDCEHSFCRDCLRSYVKAKLVEGRYPIPCPVCSADKTRTEPGTVNQSLMEELGLSQREFDKLQELQLSAHSVQLECPSCHESMFVVRQEYLEQDVLRCPLPRCGHRWCKACKKTITGANNKHACKADKLDRLMRKKGWRYCPGCTSPIQKESGCNHMKCTSPGCNVHFCYKCGVLILDASTGQDVGVAVDNHYLRCTQFEKSHKCTIQ